jgi:hypothetical protein
MKQSLPFTITSNTKINLVLPAFWSTRFSSDNNWALKVVFSNQLSVVSVDVSWLNQRWVLPLLPETLLTLVSNDKIATRYSIEASRANESTYLERGRVDLLPDVASMKRMDARTNNEKILDALNATLLKKATDDQLSYLIDGLEIKRYDVDKLAPLVQLYEAKVYREKCLREGRSTIKRIGTTLR